MNVRPGLNINIVINVDHMRETIDVGNSIIHEIEDDVLIVAQTDPPISRTRIGQEMLVTYLEKEAGKVRRLGFPAIVTGFVKDYELSGSVKVQALALKMAGDAEEYNLRMFFRLEPPGNCGLHIGIHGKPVNLIDISIGGTKFSYEKSLSLNPGDEIAVTLFIDTTAYSVKGRVLRVWEPENERIRKTIAIASVQFTEIEAQIKNVLARKIRDVEREMRYKDSDMDR